MLADPIVIAAAARTPIGGFRGALAQLSATALGAVAIREAVSRAGLAPEAVDQVVMGCVLSAGLGQAPARQASRAAGLPLCVPATTVNKMCGSGLQAAILAHDMIAAGSAEIVVAGGMESMSNAPFLLTQHRAGKRLGHDRMHDHMMLDGLEDPFESGTPMGVFAERAAARHGVARAEQDAYAIESLRRALAAERDGVFADEIAPVALGDGAAMTRDEQPARADPSKIPAMRPVFATDGTITPASSSSISDGAAALVLLRESEARRRGIAPLARIAGHAVHAGEPSDFPCLPTKSIEKLTAALGWPIASIGLFEINEAFAVVPILAARGLAIPRERINVHGGACALGHPIGASGARVLATLLHAMRAPRAARGIASLCLGGGEAVAMAVEACD